MAHAKRNSINHNKAHDVDHNLKEKNIESFDSVLSPKKEWSFTSQTLYEFTINLNDSYQVNRHRTKGISLRYVEAKATFESIMKLNTWKYFLVPEISMPQVGDMFRNTVPRIHWHGFVIFPDNDSILQHLLVVAVKLADIGRYQFNLCRPEYWMKYCLKHQNIFKSLGYVNNVEYIDDIAQWKPDNDKLGIKKIVHKNETFVKDFFADSTYGESR